MVSRIYNRDLSRLQYVSYAVHLCAYKADADDFAEVVVYEEHLSVLVTTSFISRHIRSHETTHYERNFHTNDT